MSGVPGEPLSRCINIISEADFQQMALQMRDHLAQIGDILNKFTPAIPICNTLSDAVREPRILGGQTAGPFPDEASFSQVLRFSDDPVRRGKKIVFCHAGLNPRNILIARYPQPDGSLGWRVSGIAEWEMSGYYPEYWDNSMALVEAFRWPLKYNGWVREWFIEFRGYSREADVERRSWKMGDGL